MNEREVDQPLLVGDERDLVEETLHKLERRDPNQDERRAHEPDAPTPDGRKRVEGVRFTGEGRHSRVVEWVARSVEAGEAGAYYEEIGCVRSYKGGKPLSR